MIVKSNMSRFTLIRPAFIFLILILSFFTSTIAEEPEEALKKIKEKGNFIKQASIKFNINYKILSAIIYTERTLNYDWRDDALDILIAESGFNSSIGFCQIKLKTAYWIEKQLNESKSIHYSGKQYEGVLLISKNPEEIITKLAQDSLNILYGAAYIRIILSRWEKEDYPIDNKPEIIGTLYSTGLFYSDGKERFPKINPQANEFGKRVKSVISMFQE